MSERATQAIKALSVYYERGLAAVEALENKDYDLFNQTMNSRHHAFLNFKSLDAAAQEHGVDIGSDPKTQALYQKVNQIHRNLSVAIAFHQKELAVKLKRQTFSLKGMLRYLTRR